MIFSCLASIDGLLENAVLGLELFPLFVILTHCCFLLRLKFFAQVRL